MRLFEAVVRPREAYFDGLRAVRLVYRLKGRASTDLRFNIVEQASGAVVQTLYREDAAAGTRQGIVWDGLAASGLAASGELRFEITGVNGEQITKAGSDRPATSFILRGFIFPLPGRHTYGDGIGAGRNHGGQDLPAACGKALIAARGGRVREAGFEAGGAGNYLVVNARSSELDYVYMHMEAPAAVATGERVRTGQLVGRVGSTGHSTGCHLHFELWRGAWGQSGTRLNPTPALKRWDHYS